MVYGCRHYFFSRIWTNGSFQKFALWKKKQYRGYALTGTLWMRCLRGSPQIMARDIWHCPIAARYWALCKRPTLGVSNVEIKILEAFKVWGTTTLRLAARSIFCDGGEGFLEMSKVSRTRCSWKRASFFRELEDAASSRAALVDLCAARIASRRIGDGWRAPLQTWNVNGTEKLNNYLNSQRLSSPNLSKKTGLETGLSAENLDKLLDRVL